MKPSINFWEGGLNIYITDQEQRQKFTIIKEESVQKYWKPRIFSSIFFNRKRDSTIDCLTHPYF